jgi:hypothetical protein
MLLLCVQHNCAHWSNGTTRDLLPQVVVSAVFLSPRTIDCGSVVRVLEVSGFRVGNEPLQGHL